MHPYNEVLDVPAVISQKTSKGSDCKGAYTIHRMQLQEGADEEQMNTIN